MAFFILFRLCYEGFAISRQAAAIANFVAICPLSGPVKDENRHPCPSSRYKYSRDFSPKNLIPVSPVLFPQSLAHAVTILPPASLPSPERRRPGF